MPRTVAGPARLASVLAALSAVTALTACSSDDATPPEAAPATETQSAPAWNPCSGLDAATVSGAFDTVFDTRLGTADAPLCTFAPQTEGGPAVDVNYQTYAGTLDDLLASFGLLEEPGRTTITSPDVPGADEARVIVDIDTADPDATIAITAFVQNGRLVQIVNTLDPAPFDQRALTTAVTSVLSDLAANADTSGLVGSG